MIIAILEDNKGFRASYNLIKFMPDIQIPERGSVSGVYFKDMDKFRESTIKSITFHFHRWLDEKKVALYREAK